MIRIALAVLVALLLGGALTLLWRRHRRVFWPALATTILCVAAIASYVAWMPEPGSLPADAVRLEVISLEPVAGSYRLRARVHNLSRDKAIVRLPVRLVVESCDPPGGTACTVRGDRTQPVLITVEPGQAAEFFQVFPLEDGIPRAQLRWRVVAGAALGREASRTR